MNESVPQDGMRFLQSSRAPYVVLACVVVASSALVIAWSAAGGIQFGSDSSRYIEGGTRLLAGEPLPPKAPSYIGYVALVGLFEGLGLGLPGIIALQIAVAAVAAVCAFDLARGPGGPWAGVVTALLFVSYLDLVRWHRYVLTDSLYISGVMIAMWSAHRAAESAGRWYGISAALVLFAALIRPNGWLLVPIVAVYWLLRGVDSRVLAVGTSAAVAFGFVTLVAFTPVFRAAVEEVSPVRLLADGAVIWGAPETWVDMPREQAESDRTVGGVLRYVAAHPIVTARVAGLRVAWEIVHVRPYYSVSHNLYIAAVLVPTYLLAFFGFWRARRTPLSVLLATVFGMHLGMVAITFADYDGRFLLYALPMLMVLAGIGATGLFRDIRTVS